MRSKEEIIDPKFVSLETDVKQAIKECMNEFAKEQSMSFADWKWANRWFSFENGYWYHTFEQGTSISEKTYNKYYRKTTAELYELFLNSQQH